MCETEDYRSVFEAPQHWVVERYVDGDNYVTVVDMLGERMIFEYPLELYAQSAMSVMIDKYESQ